MRVRLLQPVTIDGETKEAGQEVDVLNGTANALVRSGSAQRAAGPPENRVEAAPDNRLDAPVAARSEAVEPDAVGAGEAAHEEEASDEEALE